MIRDRRGVDAEMMRSDDEMMFKLWGWMVASDQSGRADESRWPK